MKRTLNIVLLLVILLAACFVPLQHSDIEHGEIAQITVANHNYATSEIEPSAFKHSHPTVQTILFLLFIMSLFKLSPPHASLKFHIRSFVPTLRLLYLLNPIKYKSKFIG
ncbi:hypothetical protein Back11_56780 [Paenibacillus baekrokdamisoli]|uniref:Uncharacterized protein n=1 Tax=Paenibacillus baekrokdamisoli TaxID=1712516 RepID=A0A3G9JH94_9BACL|nr:hypothetical protein [Paenibacillus baekrokdamisoli]MBB3073160.1 hypothetical protein [Paenibacillus baekrokdamisoli]BBH24333.1 hypothetical protein Back11_56780 [Paenibacillus baekrokdamisoli]